MAMTITYKVKNGIYVNMTNRCPCACTFCLRQNAPGVYGSDPLWLDREPEDFVLQAEEVSEVRWFDFDDCLRILFDGTVPSCVYEEELNLLKPALGL